VREQSTGGRAEGRGCGAGGGGGKQGGGGKGSLCKLSKRPLTRRGRT
jgi:hypothetical protein